jgi:hypothetical protein
MSRAAQTIPRERLSKSLPGSLGAVAAALFLVICFTRGFYLGDTSSYTAEVVQNFGRSPFGPDNRLWEFGHLLWRPFGWILLTATEPVLSKLLGWEPTLILSYGFIAVSLLCGFLTVLLWHALAFEITRSRAIAFLIAIGFACGNGFLTYIHSGTPYVPGLFSVTLAVWMMRRHATDRAGSWLVWGSAALAALAALLWFPYVLSLPGVFLSGLLPLEGPVRWQGLTDSGNIRLAVRFFLVAALCLMLGLVIGAAARQIGSVSEAKAWVADSQHGWSQSIRIVRLATGLPRTFLYMGRDGMLFRRFLRKDPYSPVTVQELVTASLWKMLAVYAFAFCLLYLLVTLRRNHGALLLLLAAWGPVLAFAVLLFEPGSPERYFPAYPFLVMAAACALRDIHLVRRAGQMMVAAFLITMAITNSYYMYRPRIDREDQVAKRRVAGIKAAGLRERSLVAILSNQDSIEQLLNRSPEDFAGRPRFRLYGVIEPGTLQVLTWRQTFAREALDAWSRNADVWVSKWLWQSKPHPDANWVEGDDARIQWREIPEFFGTLKTGEESGGPDGFFQLPRGSNMSRLAEIASPRTVTLP